MMKNASFLEIFSSLGILLFSIAPTFALDMTAWPSEIMKLRPVIYYDMDADPNSSPINDPTQNSFGEIRLNGGLPPQLISGPKGNAWDFSGTNASLCIRGSSIHSLGNVDIHRGLSVSFWMKDNGNPSNTRIGGFGYGKVCEIIIQSGLVKIYVNGNGYNFSSGANLLDGQWHHVALSIDFASESSNVNLYADGVLDGQYSTAFTDSFMEYRSDHPMYMAARPSTGNTYCFKGALDDLALFDYPLSASDAAMLKNYTPGSVSVAVPVIDTGKTIAQLKNHPTATLSATVTNTFSSTTYQWSLVQQGSNPVTIADASALTTQVTFTPQGDYDAYRFRLRVTTPDTFAEEDRVVVFHDGSNPASRTFSPVPAAGVHPRILFSPEDLPELRQRFNTVPSIIASAAWNKTNTDAVLSGSVYDQLKAGDTSAPISDDGMADAFSRRSYIALMEEDTAKLNELATAFGTFCEIYGSIYQPSYNNYLTHDVNMHVGFTYDFLSPYMTEPQRNAARVLISKMTYYRFAYGVHNPLPQDISTNWKTYHDNIVICALAIEGEPGYDERIFKDNLQKLRTFLTQYGIHANGFPHEGIGYFCFGMEKGIYSILAAARRDENFFETTRLYKSVRSAFYELQPWPGGEMYSHHDGQGWGTGYYLGNFYWTNGYVYPQDPVADYLVRAYTESPYNEPRKNLLAGMMFAKSPLPGNNTITEAASSKNLPTSIFEPERGIVNMRSSWNTDAVRMDFECRMDTYYLGHLHSDRNSFNFMAMDRQWFTDNDYHDSSNDLHATVLIDGLGHDDTSTKPSWPALPGKFLEYRDEGNLILAAGDAFITYNYDRNSSSGPLAAGINLTYADFVYPGTVVPAWKQNTAIGDLYEYNPVLRAFRTAMLVRGDNPYAIIVDDIQKDNSPHTYQWLANVPKGDEIVTVSADNENIILRHKDDTAPGTPRLLVRVMKANGTASALHIDERANGAYYPGELHKMLIIQRSDVIAPDFKVLFYPFHEGDPLPTTTWDGDQLKITTETDIKTFAFSVDGNGRTHVTLISTCPRIPVNGNLAGDDNVTFEDFAAFSQNWMVCFGLEDLFVLASNWLCI